MKEKKYISFDVYDTLVKRIFRIEDIYDFMQVELKELDKINIQNFRKLRLQAEREARSIQSNYTIYDIYNTNIFSFLKKEEKDRVISLEKKYEILNTIPNMEGKKKYQLARENNYDIIYISDMYLGKEVIEEILKRNNYDIHKIYVSCDYDMSKREKKLFQHVLRENNIQKKLMTHYGDAKKSDFLNAKLCGIKSKLIKNKEDRYYVGYNCNGYYYNIGFNLFGPVMYEFCKWIKKYYDINKNIKFVSREGIFIGQCFSKLYDIEVENIYLSRKSVLNGIAYKVLQTYTLNDLIKIISIMQTEKVEDFFRRIGLDIKKYSKELEKYHIGIDDTALVNYEDFYKNNKEDIMADLKNNYELFTLYLEQEIKQNVTLVDIGWKGSMQDLLELYYELGGLKQKVNGIYLGTLKEKNKEGFLFTGKTEEAMNFLCFSGLLEIIMMPELGSVIGYKSGEKINPVLDKNEFSQESKKVIEDIHRGIFEFIERMKEFNYFPYFSIKLLKEELMELGCNPTQDDIKKLGNLNFYDNGKSQKLIHVSTLKEMKRNFLDSKWKTGYMKKVLKVKLPYHKMINYMRGKRENV